MRLPNTEFIIFPSSEAFRSNSTVLSNVLGPLSKVDELQSIYAGLQVKDLRTGYIFNNWDTLDDFKRFIAGPEFPVVLEKLKLSTAGPPVIHHVTFTSDVNLALGKPLTEIVLATVSTPEAKQEFLAASEQVSLATGRMATYGSVECIDNLVAFICGWESEEDRRQTVKESLTIADNIAKMASVASFDVQFVRLTQYLPK